MRVKTRSGYIIALSLIFLLAVSLFSFMLSVNLASADTSSITYLSAEVTTSSGEFIPSSFIYDNSPVSLSFILYKSTDGSTWTIDDTYDDKFTLKYYDPTTDSELSGAPSDIGSYTVKVVAKDSTLSNFYNEDNAIYANTAIGSAFFTIYSENLYFYSPLLDDSSANDNVTTGSGSLLLGDSALDVVTGNKLYIGDTVIDSSKYNVEVRYESAPGEYLGPATVDKVGSYCLVVDIDSSMFTAEELAALSYTQASALEKDGSVYRYYRYFTVICENLSFSLASFSRFFSDSRDVKLDSGSVSTLTTIAGANYETQLLYYPLNDGIGRVIAPDGADSDLYHPTEIGSYVYRVIIGTKQPLSPLPAAAATYGIARGDYVDLSFEIVPLPFKVRYFLNETKEDELTDTISSDGTTSFDVWVFFYDLKDKELSSVYYEEDGTTKYSVEYEKHNGSNWEAATSISAEGKYRVVVKFKEAVTIGGYTIPKDYTIRKVFCIVKGLLEVNTTKAHYYHAIGSASIPTFTFTSISGDVSDKVGSYTVKYYTEDGTLLSTDTAPTAVGTYVYELTITNAIEALSVPIGMTYMGKFSIDYRPIDVVTGESPLFRDQLNQLVVLSEGTGESPDYTVSYYKSIGDNIYQLCAAKPTTAGQYRMQIAVNKNLANLSSAQLEDLQISELDLLQNYFFAAGSVYSHSYSISGDNAEISISISSDLAYDGGVKVPSVSATYSANGINFQPLVDYQLAYYKYSEVIVSETESYYTYLPCDAPLYAGTYRCVVTVLKNDPTRGLVAGHYVRNALIVTARTYNAVFTIKDTSKDLVYDAKDKEYDVALTYNARPVELDGQIKYATSGGDFGDLKYKNVGNYRARYLLNDDLSGSLFVANNTINFSVEPLSLKATFVVALGYKRMWTGEIVEPEVRYACQNGRYKDALLEDSDIELNEAIEYFHTTDGNVWTEKDPIMPGTYRKDISLGNTNVFLSAVDSIGNDGTDDSEVSVDAVSNATLEDGVARQVFAVTPREIEVQFTYTSDFAPGVSCPIESLYHTGDAIGVLSVKFMAYKDKATGYSDDVFSAAFAAAFANDYKIYYYQTDNFGNVDSEDGRTEKYFDKGYYVARLMVEPDGTEDGYLDCYSFKNGKLLDELIGENPLCEYCYVDDFFQIKEQSTLDIIFDFDSDTFAENDENKTVSVNFYNNLTKVTSLNDSSTIMYYKLKEDGTPDLSTGSSDSFKTAGNYCFILTFNESFPAYHLENKGYSGEEYYITKDATLRYDFKIFEKRQMTISFIAPSSMLYDESYYAYYDGNAKGYDISFIVQDDDELDCAVTLTEGTHYTLRYYQKKGDHSNEKLDSAPTVPGKYAVECEFLQALKDYKWGGVTIDPEKFYLLSDAVDSEKVAAKHQDFEIKKAQISVNGIKANDKEFNNTDVATFDERGVSLSVLNGENVHNVKLSWLTGSLTGTFAQRFPSDDPIVVTLNDKYSFDIDHQDYNSYYEFIYPDSFTAKISKAKIKVLPEGKAIQGDTAIIVEREYNPYAITSVINYHLEYDKEFFLSIFSATLEDTALVSGTMTYDASANGGKPIGDFPIITEGLSLNKNAVASYEGRSLSDLFELSLGKECLYKITERKITVAVKEGQFKIYGDHDPEFEVDTSSLIYGDEIYCTVSRTNRGENVGTRYELVLSDIKILDKNKNDVSSYYSITKKNAYFEIRARELTLEINAQTGDSYFAQFKTDDIKINASSYDYKTGKASRYDLTGNTLPNGDKVSVTLSYDKTPMAVLANAIQFRITHGAVTVVSVTQKNVTSNYSITWKTEINPDNPPYYTVSKKTIQVKLKEDAVLQKYYGDKDPIIAYDIETTELSKLGNLSLISASSIGRYEGESVGEYPLLADNSARSFLVYDNGTDVTDYFIFIVRGSDNRLVSSSETVFRILPRQVIVTVEEATYEETGRVITPVLKYLNVNGSKLSATLSEDLEGAVSISVPEIDYKDGENLVTPVIEGETANYEITLQAGKITLVYLRNVLSVTPLESTDKIYSGRKYMLSGIMLYKTVRFYKVESANGEQPSHSLSIALPVDKSLAGEDLVVLSLKQDGSSKALSFKQSGQTIVYQDDTAYYVAIAEVQEWFYVIWGVVIIIALVALYFLVRLVIFLVKKAMKKRALSSDNRKKKRRSRQGGTGFIPTGSSSSRTATADAATTQTSTDSLFSDTAVTDTAPTTPVAPIVPIESIGTGENTDDLFTDVAPTDAAPSVGLSADQLTTAPEMTAPSAGLVSDQPILSTGEGTPDASPSVSSETSSAQSEDSSKKKKKDKEKDKKEKKDKKGKKDDANKPKGFTPTAFKPKGDRSAAYAPTRSFAEDLFVDEQMASQDNGDSLLSDANMSDDAIIVPSTSTSTHANSSGDDELIIARSSGFSFDDAADENNPEGKKPSDDDMM